MILISDYLIHWSKYFTMKFKNINKNIFFMALRCGSKTIISFLIKHLQIDPSMHNNYAIGYACKNGHLKVAELLLKDKRVNPAASHNCAFRRACDCGHYKIVELLLNDNRCDPADLNNAAI